MRSARRAAAAVASAILLLTVEHALAQPSERCIYDLTPPEQPYYVLGSRVVPQSGSVAVADCGKTLAQVKAELAAQGRARANVRAALRVFRGAGANPERGADGSFRNCAAARAAGYGPIQRGSPAYAPHLDGDSDGIACE